MVSRASGYFWRWLRSAHAWVGLWGALLGLLFGCTGFFLNHRATLKIPAAQVQETRTQITLESTPENPQQLGKILAERLHLNENRLSTKVDAPRKVIWNNIEVQQPAHWNYAFEAPQKAVRADYWAGNRFVSVQMQDPNLLSFLTRLHKSQGASVAWIILADTLAGSLILLSLSGLLLWTRLRKPRLIVASILLTVATLIPFCAWMSF